MRSCTLAMLAAAAFALGEAATAVAQSSGQGRMFYNPSLGQPFAPRPSGFGGGIQTGPAGDFRSLGRPGGVTDFATPWRQVPVEPAPILGPASAVQRVMLWGPLPDSSAAAGSAAGVPAAPKLPPAVSLGASGVQASPPAQQVFVTPPGIGLPGGAVITGGAGGTAGGTAAIRSPRLSERLTRIAQSRGVLSGRGIDVYLSNNTARIEGDVRTAGGRALLANVLSLEPGVGAIANRLSVAGYQPNSTPANGP